jgi:hypothetical protein
VLLFVLGHVDLAIRFKSLFGISGSSPRVDMAVVIFQLLAFGFRFYGIYCREDGWVPLDSESYEFHGSHLSELERDYFIVIAYRCCRLVVAVLVWCVLPDINCAVAPAHRYRC